MQAQLCDLTGHEQRIASMVTQGLLNREIADELKVSRRAVEFHLTNIYRKLGIRRRVQLPGALTHVHGPART